MGFDGGDVGAGGLMNDSVPRKYFLVVVGSPSLSVLEKDDIMTAKEVPGRSVGEKVGRAMCVP